jgi:branched-chain amino acid transport system substrate-binding protein
MHVDPGAEGLRGAYALHRRSAIIHLHVSLLDPDMASDWIPLTHGSRSPPVPSPVRRRLLKRAGLAAAGSLLLAAAGCGTREPLRVGFLGGLSGRVSDLGIGGRNGTQLAVDDINAAGGIGGRLLELTSRDDEQNAELARQRLGELHDLGVEFVIGPMTSTVAAAVLPLANERGVPLISPLAGANDFRGRDDAFFRVVSDSAASARQQADELLRRGLRRIATVADIKNAVFTRNWATSAAERFTAGGGAVVPAIEFEAAPGLKFLDLAQRIADTAADGVIVAASAADSALLVQQLRRLRPQTFIALSVWAGTEELPALGGRALDGVLVTQFFDRFNSAQRWLDFVARYRQRFGDTPGYAALNGYDALRMGAAAASASGAAGPAGVLAALRQIRQLEGLQRQLRFDEFGDCLAPTYLTEVQQGRYVAVTA